VDFSRPPDEESHYRGEARHVIELGELLQPFLTEQESVYTFTQEFLDSIAAEIFPILDLQHSAEETKTQLVNHQVPQIEDQPGTNSVSSIDATS